MVRSYKPSRISLITVCLLISVISLLTLSGAGAISRSSVGMIFHNNDSSSNRHASVAFATITVTGTADDANIALLNGNGTCDLREAIEASNTNASVGECVVSGTPGLDTIQFDIGTGTPTINLAAPLQFLNDAVMILGDTGGATRVELNGALAGPGDGLTVLGGNSVIRSLVINNFDGYGITLSEIPGNTVTNCYIGVNAAGTAAAPNTLDGIHIDAQGNNNVIGGTTVGARNIISGNFGAGISIVAGINNTIQGNFIGTDVTGMIDLGNGGDGVNLDSTSGNTIGGTTTGAGNVISGNGGDGVSISGSTNNQVQGNLIGVQATGGGALGNDGIGVRFSGSSNNTIGGTATGAGNTIAFSGSFGIFIPGGGGNSLLGNSIFGSTSLGINLSDDLVTPNDPGDTDSGANGLQNFPDLISVSGSVLTASLNSLPNTDFRVEYFANSTCDPSGHGQGEVFLGARTVTTDTVGDTGNFTFSFTPQPNLNVFTMTATNLTTGDTSEFSACLSNTPPTISAMAQVRQQGSPGIVSPIATVNDAETPPGSLVVNVVSSPPGIIITGITNSMGTIIADVAADCTAAIGKNSVILEVLDGSGGVDLTTFTVTVTPNTPPTLNYTSPQVVSVGGNLIVNPAATPTDNGSFSVTLLSAGTYTGSISVAPTTGVVTLTAAAPAGLHTIQIISTDNCGVQTNASFMLDVSGANLADLAITAVASSTVAIPDHSITYTLTVTNNGPVVSPNTVVNNLLPAAFTVEAITTGMGTCSGIGTNTVNCNLGLLAVGAPAIIQIQAHVPETCQPTTVANIATVSGDVGDPVPGNNSANVTTIVQLANLGPGDCIPSSQPPSDNKPGSVLFGGLFVSGATVGPGGDPGNNTAVSFTNTHPWLGVVVHLFFVDGTTCSVADAFICLTPNQTTRFLMSDMDPGVVGYMMAIAVDGPAGTAGGNNTGCPISFNYLIGSARIKMTNSPTREAELASESCASQFGSPLPGCDPNKPFAEIPFDGTPQGFNKLPLVLGVSNIPSRADGNDTLLMLARIDGNWMTGLRPLGNIFGILYDDAENAASFSFNASTCLIRMPLSNAFPRTVPRLEQMIPAGRSGWMRLWSADNVAIMGAIINRNDNVASSPNAFKGGHNLHVLRLNERVIVTVPVFPPSC